MEGLFGLESYWYWLILAALLLIQELITGGGFLLWVGIAAAVTACLLWLFPSIIWPVQLLIFGITAVLACVLWWRHLRQNPESTDQPGLNRRSEQYIGRVFMLETAIINGRGKVKIGDSLWRVTGSDMAKGERVKVVAAEGVLLHVEQDDNESLDV